MKFTLSAALLTGLASLASAQSPQMPGLSPSCNRYHYVQSGDTCAVIAAANGISIAQFLSWNPEVNAGCTNLWLNYFVCTGVSATTSSTAGNGGTTLITVTSTAGNGGTTTGTATSTAGNGGTTTTSTGATSTPTNTAPQMPGLPSNCSLFHTVVTGDTCEVIAASYGISLAAFAAWNPEVNSTCTNLWLGFAVCVGV